TPAGRGRGATSPPIRADAAALPHPHPGPPPSRGRGNIGVLQPPGSPSPLAGEGRGYRVDTSLVLARPPNREKSLAAGDFLVLEICRTGCSIPTGQAIDANRLFEKCPLHRGRGGGWRARGRLRAAPSGRSLGPIGLRDVGFGDRLVLPQALQLRV